MMQLSLFDRPAPAPACGAVCEELRCTKEPEHLGVHYDQLRRMHFMRPAWRSGITGELVEGGNDE